MDQIRIVEEAIERIEHELPGPLTVRGIASSSPLSIWHFQRVFRALVGDSVGGYIRKRRLSRSIEELLESDARILDIALQYGFESQESYTRAFADLFGLPPGRFRDRGQRALGIGIPRLSPRQLRHRRTLETMEPRFHDFEGGRFVGLSERFISVISESANAPPLSPEGVQSETEDVIPSLWQRFYPRLPQISNRIGADGFGIASLLDETETECEDEMAYLASVRVSQIEGIPTDMEARALPPAHYAVFEHSGPLEEFPELIRHLLLEWLPRSEFVLGRADEIDRFWIGEDSDRPRVECWLPIESGLSKT